MSSIPLSSSAAHCSLLIAHFLCEDVLSSCFVLMSFCLLLLSSSTLVVLSSCLLRCRCPDQPFCCCRSFETWQTRRCGMPRSCGSSSSSVTRGLLRLAFLVCTSMFCAFSKNEKKPKLEISILWGFLVAARNFSTFLVEPLAAEISVFARFHWELTKTK